MDTQQGSAFSWPYFCQRKTMEELKQSLLCTTLELEQTRLAVQEQLRKRDDEIIELKESLNKSMKERDEAQEKCQRLFLEKLLLQQQQQQVSSFEDEPKRGIDSNNGFSSSDCEESIVSSTVLDQIPQAKIELVPEKPLPEKGKLLQAVMKAGPLLQTLLLAGPLPQWRHPPPPLDSFQIPPVTIPSPPPLDSFQIPPVTIPSPPPPPQHLHQDSFITTINGCNTLNTCGKVNRKRSLFEGSDYPTETKHQRLALH